jgi:transposase
MIKIEFLEQDLKTINEQRFSHPVPLVQRRMEALWLKSQGLSHKQIVKLADVSINSLTKYLRLYRDGGLDAVRNVNFYRPESDLEQHKVTIEQYFLENPVASIAEARAKIEELTGIRRSKTQVGVFLKKVHPEFAYLGVEKKWTIGLSSLSSPNFNEERKPSCPQAFCTMPSVSAATSMSTAAMVAAR